jgi:hypothetical protein
MLAAATISGGNLLLADSDLVQSTKKRQEHTAWVRAVLTKMLRVKPSMTRKELLAVFTTEGGLFTRLRRVYVSRDCPYFKVDVTFSPVGESTAEESNDDVIATISRPYLQFSIMD